MGLLTKLEELILLSIWQLKDNAYGTTIYRLISEVTGKKLSLGGVYFPLDRLVKKGYLNTFVGNATEKRRGLSKRYYTLSSKGLETLRELHQVNAVMWAGFTEPHSENTSIG